MNQPTSQPKPCLRFSLLNLLLLTTISASAMGITNSYLTNRDLTKQNSHLLSQNNWLRSELGIEISKDPTVLCAQQIGDSLVDLNELQWSWMINIPQEGKYELRFATELLPAVGYPTQFIS